MSSMSKLKLREEEKIELENILEAIRKYMKSKVGLTEEERIEIKNKIKDDFIKVCEYMEDDGKFSAYKEKHGAGRDEYEVYKEWSKPFPPKISALIDNNWVDIREYLKAKYPECDEYTINCLFSEWSCWYIILYRKFGMAWLRGE